MWAGFLDKFFKEGKEPTLCFNFLQNLLRYVDILQTFEIKYQLSKNLILYFNIVTVSSYKPGQVYKP